MNEWLDIMLEEIDRKEPESKESEGEAARRVSGEDKPEQSDEKSG